MSKYMKVDEDQQQRDRAMVLNPSNWPNWPVLPIKRYVNGISMPETAVVYWGSLMQDPTPYSPLQVILANMGNITDDAPRHTYNGVDELIADGWMVD